MKSHLAQTIDALKVERTAIDLAILKLEELARPPVPRTPKPRLVENA